MNEIEPLSDAPELLPALPDDAMVNWIASMRNDETEVISRAQTEWQH